MRRGIEDKRTVLVGGVVFLTVLATPVVAQRDSAVPLIERRIAETNRRNEQLERDLLLRDLKEKPEAPTDRRQLQAVFTKVQQDFDRLQVINKEIVRSVSANNVLDYKFITVSTAEIGKCASRLKTNLALPEIEDDQRGQKKHVELGQEQMKPSLIMLTNHIISFVTNPLFESAGPLDVKLSSKASRDLKEIMELSDGIRKRAEKVNRMK